MPTTPSKLDLGRQKDSKLNKLVARLESGVEDEVRIQRAGRDVAKIICVTKHVGVGAVAKTIVDSGVHSVGRIEYSTHTSDTVGASSQDRLTRRPKRPAPGWGRKLITIVSDDEDHLRDFHEYMPGAGAGGVAPEPED